MGKLVEQLGHAERRLTRARGPQDRMTCKIELFFHSEDPCKEGIRPGSRKQEDRLKLPHFLRDPLHFLCRHLIFPDENRQPVTRERCIAKNVYVSVLLAIH